jgi:Bacterial capsule synthesis protein PGA_cap
MVGYARCKACLVETIGLLGDVMLGRGVAEHLTEVPPEEVWSPEFREICLSCDLVICNLECCVSECGEPTRRIPGKPFFFRGPSVAVDSLRAIGVAAVGLANNHALDYEDRALLDTLELLGEAGIEAAGAGRDMGTARRGAIVERAGSRIGLLAVSDHPREYAAGEDEAGIAYADLIRGPPDWLFAELGRLRDACELVIAFPHWGPNMNPQTAPWQLEATTDLMEAGATLVAGHSAHVFHGIGWPGGKPALYDLGDALDDYAVDSRLRNDLGVLALWRPGSAEAELELVGLRLDYCRTTLARGTDADWIAPAERWAAASTGLTSSAFGSARRRSAHASRLEPPQLPALQPPGDDPLGVDPDPGLIAFDRLRAPPHLDAPRPPGIDARQVVDHDRRTAAPPDVPELLGAGQVHAADVDRVELRVEAPAHWHHMRRPVLAHSRDPAKPLRPPLAEILEFARGECAHRPAPAVATSLNWVLRATTPRSTSLNCA